MATRWQPECPVCFAPYDEEECIPLVLECGHSICKVCVQGIANAKREVLCPSCRAFCCRSDDIERIKTNFIVMDYLRSASSESAGSDAGVPVGKCTKHAEHAREYDERCKKLVCATCLATDHRGHTCTNAMTALSSISSSVTKAREQLSARATNIAKALIDVKKRKEAASRDGEESMKRITTFFKEMTDAVIARNEECVLDLTSQIASATDSLDSHEAGLLVDKDDVEQALLRLANVERGPLSLLQEGGDEVARVWAAYYTKATPSLPYETPLSFASSTGVLQAIRRAGQVGHGAAAVTSVQETGRESSGAASSSTTASQGSLEQPQHCFKYDMDESWCVDDDARCMARFHTRIYVGYVMHDRITVHDLAGEKKSEIVLQMSGGAVRDLAPVMMAISQTSGEIFASFRNWSRIEVFHLTGKHIRTLATSSRNSSFIAACFNSDETKLFACDATNEEVAVFDANNGDKLCTFGATRASHERFTKIIAISYDRANKYVCVLDQGRVSTFDQEGVCVRSFTHGTSYGREVVQNACAIAHTTRNTLVLSTKTAVGEYSLTGQFRHWFESDGYYKKAEKVKFDYARIMMIVGDAVHVCDVAKQNVRIFKVKEGGNRDDDL